jgi:hypothetical protein
MGGTIAGSTVLPSLSDEIPAWWPYSRQFPHWHVWRGVAGLLYARRPRTSPPKIVRAKDPLTLRDRIAQAETR